jgi:hypothetical protein
MGWLRGEAESAITLQELSFLIMNAFDLRGGLMYTLFRNPRYAYREMIYRQLIQGRAYSNMNVSGIRFLQILGRVLSHTGENDLPDAEMQSPGIQN